ncbi:MAG: PDZ domain-containing protein [Planctomycetota bacterium]|nr:MAG: PDZ domain-containing protein [Planctomycetota bacterium]KAB2946208.1 MAG: trypsin-like serine protease [Phycisphaerae bacterium]MCQ3920957.1 hypothetical protein [Planctomycetota bacterium]
MCGNHLRRRRVRSGLGWMLAWTVCCAAAVALPARAQSDGLKVADLRQIQNTFARLADELRPSVAAIRTFDYIVRPGENEAPRGRRIRENHGTGFILSSDGLIVTNHHVVRGVEGVGVILHDGREFDARVIGTDSRSDLAMLDIEAEHLKPVRLGDAGSVRVGQWAIVVGNPFGLAAIKGGGSVTVGTVSALGRDMTAELADRRGINAVYYGNLIETSAPINPGNSGGPLFNLEGEVVGIVTAIESSSGANEGVGFAIPIDRYSLRIIDGLKQGGEVRYGYIGLQSAPEARESRLRRAATGETAAPGAVIGYVEPNQPAARADLRANDRIITFNGEKVQDFDHLIRLVGATPAGTEAQVEFVRDGRTMTTRIVVTDRDEALRPSGETRPG